MSNEHVKIHLKCQVLRDEKTRATRQPAALNGSAPIQMNQPVAVPA